MSCRVSTGGKSIYAVYCAETQIITRIDATHSCFVFPSAKINKKLDLARIWPEKKLLLQFVAVVAVKTIEGVERGLTL